MPEDIQQTMARKIARLERELREKRGARSSDPTYLNGIIKTVGASGRNYTSIQEAVDFFSRHIVRGCTIAVDPGEYVVTTPYTLQVPHGVLAQAGIFAESSLLILGDTRPIAGMSFVSGNGANTVPINRTSTANCGVGNCTLSNAGNVLTVTGSTTSPNFQTAGLVAGDKVFVLDNALAWTTQTIASVSTNTITFQGACPTVGALGSAATICPNRIIKGATSPVISLTGQGSRMFLSGFLIQQTAANTTYNCVFMRQANVGFCNCVIAGGYVGLYDDTSGGSFGNLHNAYPLSLISLGQPTQYWYGVDQKGGSSRLAYATFLGSEKSKHTGFSATVNAHCELNYAVFANSVVGILNTHSQIYASYAALVNNATGVYTQMTGITESYNTVALSFGNGANFNPTPTGTAGLYGAFNLFS